MKVYIACNSILLTKTLEFYLKDMLVTSSNADVVISDNQELNLDKPYFLIDDSENTNVTKPFTKNDLMTSLLKFYKDLHILPTWDSVKVGDENYELKQELECIGKRYAQEMFWSVLEHNKRIGK